MVSCLWSPVTLPGERFFPQNHYTFSLTSDLHNRKLNPRFNDAEVFDIVKTSTDSVFPLQTENPVASMKHRDLSEQVSTNRKKLKMKNLLPPPRNRLHLVRPSWQEKDPSALLSQALESLNNLLKEILLRSPVPDTLQMIFKVSDSLTFSLPKANWT